MRKHDHGFITSITPNDDAPSQGLTWILYPATREIKLKRFSLATLILVISLVAVSIAWWVDRSVVQKTLYLHVYANSYRPHQDAWHPLNDPTANQQIANTRIGTFSIYSGKNFYYNSPIDRNPELEVKGIVEPKNGQFECDIQFWIDDPNITIEYRHQTPVAIDKLIPFTGWYYFAISESEDPYELEYLDPE